MRVSTQSRHCGAMLVNRDVDGGQGCVPNTVFSLLSSSWLGPRILIPIRGTQRL